MWHRKRIERDFCLKIESKNTKSSLHVSVQNAVRSKLERIGAQKLIESTGKNPLQIKKFLSHFIDVSTVKTRRPGYTNDCRKQLSKRYSLKKEDELYRRVIKGMNILFTKCEAFLLHHNGTKQNANQNTHCDKCLQWLEHIKKGRNVQGRIQK